MVVQYNMYVYTIYTNIYAWEISIIYVYAWYIFIVDAWAFFILYMSCCTSMIYVYIVSDFDIM